MISPADFCPLQGRLRADASGQLRGQLVRQVLAALMADAVWRTGVADLLVDFDEVKPVQKFNREKSSVVSCSR